jgi:hypothetical protein
MKSILIGFALILISDTPSKVSKADLISKKWIEVGLKVFGKEYRPVDKQSAEFITFHKNGTVEKELYGNLKFKGLWKFTLDSTKLAIEWTELNDNPVRSTPINKVKPTDSILKLSADTMILGTLKQYGDLRIHGHDDRYFVSVH